jgi:hypothetical protein
MCGDDEKEG